MGLKFNPIEGSFDLVGSGGGGGGDAFTIIQTDNGTSPTAASSTDTLTLTSSDNSIIIDGDSSTDTVTIREAGLYDAGNSSTAITVDWNNGPTQKVTISANTTISFSNGRSGMSYSLLMVENGTGGYSITLSGVDYGDAGTPTYSTTANKKNLAGLFYDGSEYLVLGVNTGF
jgi:hypothetical protein